MIQGIMYVRYGKGIPLGYSVYLSVVYAKSEGSILLFNETDRRCPWTI